MSVPPAATPLYDRKLSHTDEVGRAIRALLGDAEGALELVRDALVDAKGQLSSEWVSEYFTDCAEIAARLNEIRARLGTV